MNINLNFRNIEQETFFYSRFRNNEFDGAFANGKSYVGCMRAFTHLSLFNCYAVAIARQEYKALRQTTMKTFFKICTNDLIQKHDEQAGYTVLVNRSFIYWLHLDAYDEQDLRGLEINSALIDQAEEIVEPIYNILDSRIGRWDKATVPLWLLRSQLTGEDFELSNKIEKDKPKELDAFIQRRSLWPRHPKWGHFLVPNFMDVLCNIANDEEFHWTYRYYNNASYEKKPDHFYIHREMDQSLNDERTYQQMLLRDNEWVNKYVKGIRGTGGASIHKIHELSIINPKDYTEEEFNKFIETLRSKGALYRILDHAETGITVCSWLAILNGLHIFYREYYAERKLISQNRKAIHELSQDEEYMDDFADPQIFKKTQQSISGSKSGFWTVAMEYSDTEEITDAPPINWAPADNNEYATRNRLNELLTPNAKHFHPITKVSPAPGIFFVKKSPSFLHGMQEMIIQIKSQRRLLLGSDNGKNLYSEERDPKIADDAYDTARYGVAMHNLGKNEPKRKVKRNTFEYYNQILKRKPRFLPASH